MSESWAAVAVVMAAAYDGMENRASLLRPPRTARASSYRRERGKTFTTSVKPTARSMPSTAAGFGPHQFVWSPPSSSAG